MKTLHKRRALLYVPGDDRHKIEKAISLGVDSIILDIEDGVALNCKEEARNGILKALTELNFGKSEKLVRINPVSSGMAMKDLERVLVRRPDGIVLPKVDSGQTVRRVSKEIQKVERKMGWKSGSIQMIAICESPQAILNLQEICSSDPRLDAIIFGGEDLAADIGATRSPEGWEIFVARSMVVLHTAAAGLQAIDLVCTDFKDNKQLKVEALQGVQMGFSGKQIIHPTQVQVVQEAFTPSKEEIEWARRVVEGFESNQKKGKGAFALEGKMVDMPVVRRARNTLARGE